MFHMFPVDSPFSLSLAPFLSFSFSTSTGLSKWSQRNALWSNNPGGWHHRDESERGGERTREVGEVKKPWRGDSCKGGSGEEEVEKLRCMRKKLGSNMLKT